MHQRLLSMGFTTNDRHTYVNICLGVTVLMMNGVIQQVLKADVPVPNIYSLRDLTDLMLKENKMYGE